MIRLKKGPKPAVLEANAAAWTQTLLTKIANGEAATRAERGRYRHPAIKDALKKETHEKCAYCESKLLHVSFGDVEHITAKSGKPELTYEWENLTLACEVCNVNKATAEAIIDPYRQEPSEHLYFEGVVVVPWPGDELGYNAEKILKLNRPPLIESRKRRRDAIYALLEVLAKATNPLKRQTIIKYLENEESAPDKEYSAMSKEMIERHLNRLKSFL